MDDQENCVRIYFSTHYIKQHPDHVLAISGSIPELGQWDVGRAVIAVKAPYQPGKWILPLELHANVKFEWKWIVISRKTLNVVRWEERHNRFTELQDKTWNCHAPWNCDGEYKLLYNFPVRQVAEKKEDLESEPIPETIDVPPGRLTALQSVITWPIRCIKRFYQAVAGFVRRDGVYENND